MPPEVHSVLGASAADRWMNCTPSAQLTAGMEDETTTFAAEGTAAHALCEWKVRKALKMRAGRRPTSDYWTDEMEEFTDDYRDFVMDLVGQAKQHCKDPVTLIEQHLDFSCYVPDGFGTGDFLLVADKELNVVDFKYGRGVAMYADHNIVDDRDTEIIAVLDDFKKYCFDEKLIPDGYKWMRAIVAGTTFQDNMDLDLFYDQESRNFSEHGYIGLYKDKSIRAIGKLKKTIIAVENNGSMTYRAESGAEPTADEIERINEAIRRADHYGYNLQTISHRYFIVEKFYPMDFRKSSKNPIEKSKFFNLADMFGYKTMPNTDVIANDLNGRTWEEF